MDEPITYTSSGVNIDAGMESLKRIGAKAKETHGKNVLTGLGGFGSLYDISTIKNFKEPVLVQSVDGVGTKLMVANMLNRYDTVGIDIVNHCVNDILCQGARALTFLDYIAVESLKPEQIEALVTGMAVACKQSGVSLVGGETAELPGTYAKGEYDLVGMITGVVEKSQIITGQNIEEGNTILGLASSGLHTNGYTLARKVIFDKMGMSATTIPEGFSRTIGEVLLAPHKDYSESLLPLIDRRLIKGLAHITGGGFLDNIPRVLPSHVNAVIQKNSWEIPPVFRLIQEGGTVPEADMFRTFNMGIGMAVIVDAKDTNAIKGDLEKAGETVHEIGEIKAGEGKTVFYPA
ncbi:Phosphoribosylformylglycinamidine cyclo-ligase [hydrothermal vent metagenome]|uniref:Phosphoribosylformylglycinamidine cyclo-ligase n=1 Tax=hydrothermal vent metagenome TaxID=652676 RepID=A0A3B1CJP8_9ZZZZ